VGIQS
jgi:hypothetical protein